jgi:lipopolysaccharide assembly outer membrane protein LptD (OstA)
LIFSSLNVTRDCSFLPAVCLLVLAGCLASATEARSQTVPGWTTRQFTLERLDADRVRMTREVEVEGDPNSPNAGQKFFADEMEWNTRTGELTASGNVVFSSADARIAADRVVFNTRTRTGTFYSASGMASLGAEGQRGQVMFGSLDPDVYFYGETIEKLDVDKYRIRKGGFTTCVQPTPRWEMVSSTATINLDDYASMRQVVLRVKDVPVFYLPALYVPLQKDGRSTGILMPTYGRSTYRGLSISNGFFWAINRSQDLTLMHDWFTSRGHGLGGEYRYISGPTAQGSARVYWLNERTRTLDTVSGPVEEPGRRSYMVIGNLVQPLPGGLRANARVDYFSDVSAQQLYNNNLYQQAFSNRSIGGGLSGSWGRLSASGAFQRTESFYSSTSSFVSGQAPSLQLSYTGQRLGRLPLYLSATSEATRVLYQQTSGTSLSDLSLGRIDIRPSLRLPLSSLPFLSANATATYRVTYFSQSLDTTTGVQIPDPVTRKYFDLRTDLIGPIFTRVYSPRNAFADRLKHVVEPSVSLQRITFMPEQRRIPTAASAEFIVGGVTRVTYGLANRVLIRKSGSPVVGSDGTATSTASSAPRELLSVSVNQSYYSDKTASVFDNAYGFSTFYRKANPFSTIAFNARTTLSETSSVTARAEYDPTAESAKLVGIGLNGTLRSSIADITAGWSRQVFGGVAVAGALTSSHYVQQATTLRLLGGRLGGTVSFNYDISRSTLLNQRYIASYSAQCCSVGFEYQSFNFPGIDPRFLVPQDRRFNFTFTLAGLGTFSNFFGTFGGQSF